MTNPTDNSARFIRRPCYWEKKSQVIPNALIYAQDIGNAAKLLLMALNALPESWTPIQTDIRKRMGWGRAMMDTAIKECVKAGYMQVIQGRKTEMVRDEKGRVVKGRFSHNIFQWELTPYFDIPLDEIEHNPAHNDCEPLPGFPLTAPPTSGNQPLLIPNEHLPRLENTTTPDPEPPEKKKPGAVVVFSSLEDLGISDSLKIKVSKKHTESEVNDAVKRCLAWKGRPNDEVGIMTCLAKAAEWNDTVDKKTIVENNERYLKTLRKYDGVNMAFTLITVGTSYIEFACGRRVDVYESSMPDLQKTADARLARIKELHEKD